jgi:hypothetical protein
MADASFYYSGNVNHANRGLGAFYPSVGVLHRAYRNLSLRRICHHHDFNRFMRLFAAFVYLQCALAKLPMVPGKATNAPNLL